MSSSTSSPPQTPVTTLDELHTRAVISPAQHGSLEHLTQLKPDSTSLPIPPPVSPSPLTSSSMQSANPSIPAVQQKAQPNSPAQNPSNTSISTNSNRSCLILPEPASSSHRDPSVTLDPQSAGSSTLDSASLPRLRQSITSSFSSPAAFDSAAIHSRTFPDSSYFHCNLTTASSIESISTTCQHTPNVYINGLPPHFLEQELFALARPFGDVKSVRTFTRHVSEKPTGYGFVLFKDIESAQKCIEGLRKYRNLHPSFSKQVHRIPGTEYAQHNAPQSPDQDENSFKSRMEKLRDTTSTNLYIEGLPLSVDDESLSALVSPYKIKSSRFFKTKLSNPPRIIAFVRLETRAAAEDTIERLHGRMVRGWDDPGCRISVRFADSAEQRELRRTERTLKTGDQSPSRLTIAQASLLNLRGQELQTNVCNVAGGRPQRLPHARSDNQVSFNLGSDLGFLPTSCSLPSKLRYSYKESPLLPTSDLPITSEMDTLLQSIQNMGYDDDTLQSRIKGLTFDNEYLLTQQAQIRAFAGASLLPPNPLPMSLPRGHAQARNGFTPTEELILEAHARLQFQAQLAQPVPVFEPVHMLGKLNANVQNFDPASRMAAAKPSLSQDPLPPISEDDFHAMGHHQLHSFGRTLHDFQGLANGCLPTIPTTKNNLFVRPPSRPVTIVPPPPDYQEPGQRSKDSHQRTERSVASKQNSCSSMFNNRQSIPSNDKSHTSFPRPSSRTNDLSGNNENNTSMSVTPSSNDKHIEHQHQHTYMYSHRDGPSYTEDDDDAHFRTSPASHNYVKKSPRLTNASHGSAKEGPKSPAFVSPALTYSSRTPSTLSPATPFFGSFVGGQDVFEVVTAENDEVAEKKRTGHK